MAKNKIVIASRDAYVKLSSLKAMFDLTYPETIDIVLYLANVNFSSDLTKDERMRQALRVLEQNKEKARKETMKPRELFAGQI